MEGKQRDEAAFALQAVEGQTDKVLEFDFDGDRLLLKLLDGRPYVALKPICDFLKVDWSSQYQRIQDDDVLDAEQRTMNFTKPGEKQERPMTALPIEFLHGWIFGISAKRLRKAEPCLITTWGTYCCTRSLR